MSGRKTLPTGSRAGSRGRSGGAVGPARSHEIDCRNAAAIAQCLGRGVGRKGEAPSRRSLLPGFSGEADAPTEPMMFPSHTARPTRANCKGRLSKRPPASRRILGPFSPPPESSRGSRRLGKHTRLQAPRAGIRLLAALSLPSENRRDLAPA